MFLPDGMGPSLEAQLRLFEGNSGTNPMADKTANDIPESAFPSCLLPMLLLLLLLLL